MDTKKTAMDILSIASGIQTTKNQLAVMQQLISEKQASLRTQQSDLVDTIASLLRGISSMNADFLIFLDHQMPTRVREESFLSDVLTEDSEKNTNRMYITEAIRYSILEKKDGITIVVEPYYESVVRYLTELFGKFNMMCRQSMGPDDVYVIQITHSPVY